MNVFDTHAHYDSGAFNGDRLELLASMPSRGVELIVNPGCDLESSRTAVELSERFPFVYAAVGWQPEEWESWDCGSEALVRELARHPKCVAMSRITGLSSPAGMPITMGFVPSNGSTPPYGAINRYVLQHMMVMRSLLAPLSA